MTASRASRSFLLARACVLAMACSLAVGCGGDKDPGEAGDGKQAAVGKDGKPAEQKVEAVPVEVARASRRAIAASYTGTANLEAPGEAQVVAKTSGVMVQLLAEEGDQVRAGLKDGDRVVTAGKVAIRDGTEVQVIDAAGVAAKAVARNAQ